MKSEPTIQPRLYHMPFKLRPASRLAPLLLCLAALLAACSDPAWREVKSPEGGFRVSMQRDPRIEKNELNTPLGKVTAYWYAVEAKDSVYGVGYSDYPDAIFKHGTPRKLFSVVGEGWLKRINGKVLGDGTDILLDNRFPGMEIIASGQLDGQDAYMRGRFYLVGNRLYQVVAFGKKSAMPQSDINQFLSSFKLVPRLDTPHSIIIEGEGGGRERKKKQEK